MGEQIQRTYNELGEQIRLQWESNYKELTSNLESKCVYNGRANIKHLLRNWRANVFTMEEQLQRAYFETGEQMCLQWESKYKELTSKLASKCVYNGRANTKHLQRTWRANVFTMGEQLQRSCNETGEQMCLQGESN